MKNCYIGCSGYYYREWKELFYPRDLPQKEWLRFYSEQFNTLEINNTFYRYPTVKLFKDWHDRSPDHFKFSVKVPRIITQYRKFNALENLLTDFYSMAAEGLGDKLGCILFQLPPSYHYSEEHLEKIIINTDPVFLNVVEFRHTGWWNEKVYTSLQKNNITYCSISHPALPDNLVHTSETVYVRFHGTPELYRSAYSENDLHKWSEEILKINAIKNLYIYFNNTMTAEALENARQIRKLLSC